MAAMKNRPRIKVLMGTKEYDDLSQALAMFKLLIPAEEDINKNRVINADGFFRKFRNDKKIVTTQVRPLNPPQGDFYRMVPPAGEPLGRGR